MAWYAWIILKLKEMIVKVSELEIGDEILIGAGSRIRTLIVAKKPVVSNKYTNANGNKYYKAVRCTSKVIVKEIPSQRYDYRTKLNVDYILYDKTWEHTFENHNMRISMDLNYKDIWLIKRNGEKVWFLKNKNKQKLCP